jgi:hypothetical protein
MTSEDVRSELEKEPFIPFRIHLVSGAIIDVPSAGVVTMLQNALMILHTPPQPGYDVIALRNIEWLEILRDVD